jgi:hypothetical protein
MATNRPPRRPAVGLHPSVSKTVNMQLAKTPYGEKGAASHFTADPYSHLEKSKKPVYEGSFAPIKSVTLHDLPPNATVQATVFLDGKHMVNSYPDADDQKFTSSHGMLPGPVHRVDVSTGKVTIPLHPLPKLSASDLATRLIHMTTPSMELEVEGHVAVGNDFHIKTENPKRLLAVAEGVGIKGASSTGNAVVIPASMFKQLREQIAARAPSKVPTPGTHGLSVLASVPINSVHVDYNIDADTSAEIPPRQEIRVHSDFDHETHLVPPIERGTMGRKHDSSSSESSSNGEGSSSEEEDEKKSKEKEEKRSKKNRRSKTK